MTWDELPEWAREAVTERFPGLVGPKAPTVVWKGAGGAFVAFEGGRLLATVGRPIPTLEP